MNMKSGTQTRHLVQTPHPFCAPDRLVCIVHRCESHAMAEDGSMFGQVAPSDAKEPAAKRVCLKAYDLAPAQALNCMGVSRIESISLAELVKMLSAGNKAAKYFTDFADDDLERKGVAISRMAQVMTIALERIEGDVAAKVLDKAVLHDALKEVQELKPYLVILNGGMNQGSGSKSLKYANAQAAPKNATDVKAAAEKVYQWLNKPTSTLRSLLSFLSGGGCWYVAACHEKTARAYIKKGISEHDFTEASIKRLIKPRSEDDGDDMGAFK